MPNITTAAPLIVATLSTMLPPTSSSLISPSTTPTSLVALTDPSQFFNSSLEVSDTDSNVTEPEAIDLDDYAAFLSGSRYVVQRILVPMVLVVGVVGNAVTIVVLTRRHMQSSTNNYLTALAISDLLYLVFIFSLSLQHHPGMNEPHHWFYWHYFRYALWLTDASSSTSIWLTVTFTIERYIAVCHPIKGKVFCTESRARRVIVVVFILCFTLTATTPHEWVVKSLEEDGVVSLTLDYSSLGANNTYRKVFYWFTAVIFILLPLVLLAVFNSFLIYVVKMSRAQRQIMTSQRAERESHYQTQENKITIMLIAVVLLALLCQLPVAVLLLYQSFNESKPKTMAHYIERGLGNIFNLLAAINAACNFVLYCAMSDKYRRTFMRTFCSRWYRQRSPLHSWMATAYSNVDDGSPRFSRVSSMRMSRRSSHRSSGSGSPRGSPTHGRGHQGSRYLTVPTSASNSPNNAFLTPTNVTLHPAPSEPEDSRPLIRKASTNQKNNGTESSVTSAATAAALLNGSPPGEGPAPPSSCSSSSSRTPPVGAARRLALRLASMRPHLLSRRTQATTTHLAGTHIVITCQQPSTDEQTPL